MTSSASPRAGYAAFHWGTYEAVRGEAGGLALRGLPDDPAPSPIGLGVPDTLSGECRIKQPHVRSGWLDGRSRPGSSSPRRGGEPFVPVSWDVALDLAAGELARVSRDHGNEAIFAGSYGWGSAGRFHHPQSQLHRFMNTIGGYTRSVNSYSFAAAEVIVPHVVGYGLRPFHAQQTPWPLLAEHVELFVAFGGVPLKNSQVSPGGTGPHIVPGAMARCAERGVEFVNVSPLRDDLAPGLKMDWLAIRPNTDVAMMLALAHELIVQGRCDRDFLARCTIGFDEFEAYVLGRADGSAKSPEWAAGITGIAPDAVRELAKRMASSRTFISLSWAIQRGDHGEQPIWAGIALAAMLGQIGRPGSGFGIGYGACNYIANPAPNVRWSSLPQGRNAVSAFIPVARISDMLLNPGEPFDYNGTRQPYPEIRLIYWAGGNPFHHHQDLNRLVTAWRRPETVIVNEIWWNALARHADIVLPATTPLERNDIAAAAGEPMLVAMRQCVPPVGEARNDYEIFSGLASRLDALDAFTEGRSEMEWVQAIYDGARGAVLDAGLEAPSFETFWEEGICRLPVPEQLPVLFDAFCADPDAHPLPTPSGRIEITSRRIESFGYEDCPRHPTWIEPAERLGTPLAETYPLHLISNQPATRLHSQYDHAALSQSSKVQGREPITIHPDDAAARGIASGDVVRVFNGRGACLAGAVVSPAVRPGVVQLSTGAWYDPVTPGEVGALENHGNPNVLTLDKGTSRLAQGPSAMTALVEVEKAGGDIEARTYAPPPIEHR